VTSTWDSACSSDSQCFQIVCDESLKRLAGSSQGWRGDPGVRGPLAGTALHLQGEALSRGWLTNCPAWPASLGPAPAPIPLAFRAPNSADSPCSLWSPFHSWFLLMSCLNLSEPMDCSLPGSSVHGIFQAIVNRLSHQGSPLDTIQFSSVQSLSRVRLFSTP